MPLELGLGTWTEVGSLPGDSRDDFTRAVVRVLRDVPLPYVPELPGRAYGDMISRTLGQLEMASDLQPAGWRLTGGTMSAEAGIDQRRARALVAADLEVVEEQSRLVVERPADWITLAFAGPWTLASSVDLPRGDKVLSDPGAVRDLSDALAEAVIVRARWLARATGRTVIIQIDEPALTAVAGGRLPTISGRGRLRTPEPPELVARLQTVVDAGHEAGAQVLVHCCAANPPVDLIRQCGTDLIGLDLIRTLSGQTLDMLGEWLEAAAGHGSVLIAGVVNPIRPATPGNVAQVIPTFANRLGISAATMARIVPSPTCGMAGATPGDVQQVAECLHAAADQLAST